MMHQSAAMRFFQAFLFVIAAAATAHAQTSGNEPTCPEPPAPPPTVSVAWAQINAQPPEWYATPEAITVAENILYYQNSSGGWSPAIDMTTRTAYKTREDFGFRTQTLFLVNAIAATGCTRYMDAFERGLDRMLAAQKPNGGWVEASPYGVYYDRIIRFVDDGMTGYMSILNDILKKVPKYAFVDADRMEKSKAAFDKGIECILKCQIVANGKKTGWAAQHDIDTFAAARRSAYELPGISGNEGVGVLRFLMTIDNPSAAIIDAVHGAAAWYDEHKLLGIRVEQLTGDRQVVDDPAAPPLWARFYDIETGKPFFAGRDGVKKWTMAEIEQERRQGYVWYGDWPSAVLDAYATWVPQWGTPMVGSTPKTTDGGNSGCSMVGGNASSHWGALLVAASMAARVRRRSRRRGSDASSNAAP